MIYFPFYFQLKEAEMKFMQEFAEFEKMIDARMA